MKPFFLLCAMALMSCLPVAAQNTLPQGLSPASAHSTIDVQRCAAELLSRYTKFRDGNYLSHLRGGLGELWVESKDLLLTDPMPYRVTPADRANGIRAIHFVGVKVHLHRTYDPKTTKWTEWRDGKFVYFPSSIRVIEKSDGTLAAEPSRLSYFVSFTARGNPDLIPCVRERVVPAPAPAPKLLPPSLQLTPPLPSTDVSGKAPRRPSPLEETANKIAADVLKLGIIVVGVCTVAGIFVDRLFRRRRKGRKETKRPPSPLPIQHSKSNIQNSSSVGPPPLPAASQPAADLSHLIVGQTHLLSPAEQSFLAVLEPIVRPTCAISTKVRLADLFAVQSGPGQRAAFNRISQKHVDFVLTDPATSRILCAIELDDASHQLPDRAARDRFVDELFANNQMPILHIPFEWKYNPHAIRAELQKAGVPFGP